MSNPFRDLFSGIVGPRRAAVEAMEPRRTFADVILPEATMRALAEALNQVRNHELIFERWGLGERHASGLGLAFNFAGPPGTGKTICAEAVAHALGQRLLVVRYAELVSMWLGQTAKNVTAIFAAAEEDNAVLFFDEADAIAGRRFTTMQEGSQRESNAIVNVLLRELEEFNGVVIFATNMASNFDPAFERRIRNHIFFEMPGEAERERIWRVQVHGGKTPLAADVDFAELARLFPRSGGDIKNAVLKAALAAAAEPGPDQDKAIRQHHFIRGMEDVIAARRVMDQSVLAEGDGAAAGMVHVLAGQRALAERVDALGRRLDQLDARAGVPRSVVDRLQQKLDERDRVLDEYARAIAERDHALAASTASLEARMTEMAAAASTAVAGLTASVARELSTARRWMLAIAVLAVAATIVALAALLG